MSAKRVPIWTAPHHVVGTPIRYIGQFLPGSVFHVAAGELALEGDDCWWLACPCGSGGVLAGHTVESTDPVTISPSIVCPAGCHYFIKAGAVT